MLRRCMSAGPGAGPLAAMLRAPMPVGVAAGVVVQSMASLSTTRTKFLKKGSKTLRMQALEAARQAALPANGRRGSTGRSSKKAGAQKPVQRKPTASRRRGSNMDPQRTSRPRSSKHQQSQRAGDHVTGGRYNDPPCTARELAFANTTQIVGILRSAYEDPEPRDVAERMLRHAEDLYDGGRRLDDLILQRSKRTSGADGGRLRVRPLERIQIPPVEVPSSPTTSRFMPRELLRRVMREEPGTSIVSRSVFLQCVLRRNPKHQQQQHVRSNESSARRSRVKGSAARRGPPAAASPSVVTRVELDEAALTGNAALVVHEASTHTPKQLAEAISDDRPNTQIEDGGDHGVELPTDADTLSATVGKEVNLLPKPNAHDAGGSGDEPHQLHTAELGEGEGFDASVAVGTGEVDADAVTESDDMDELLPWASGTNIPLSTNFFTRAERLNAPCMPFTPHPYAKRVPLLQRSGEMPPLTGVAMHGTVVAVRVVHNTRKALEDASQESIASLKHARKLNKGRSVKEQQAIAASPPPQINLNRHVPQPQIVIEFFDDDDQTDFSEFLFREGPLES